MPTSFPCPNCGTAYSLSDEYLAQYGGQSTTCTRCQRQFVLPTAEQARAAAPAAAAQQAQGAAPSWAGGPANPQPLQQPGAAQVLPYRGPGVGDAQAPVYGVWREGRMLLAVKGAALPYRCVKCNGQPDGPPLRRNYSWHHPTLYLIILAGVLVYAIVALCVQQTGQLHVALCAEHRRKRVNGMLAGWGVFFAGITCFVLAGVFENGWLMIPGFLGFFGGLVWVFLAQRVLSPSKIDTHYMWMNGACEEFLQLLPPAPAPAYGGYGGGYGQYGPPPGAYGGYPQQQYPAAYGPPQGYPVQQQQFGPPR